MMKLFLFLAVGALVDGMTSYTKVTHSGAYYGTIGPVSGVSFPQMGGEHGDQVQLSAYTPTAYFVGVFDSSGTGLVDGINSSTTSASGPLTGFGDFTVSRGTHLPTGKPVIAFVATSPEFDGIFVLLPDGTISPVVTTKEEHNGQVFAYLAEPQVEVSSDAQTVFVTFSAHTGSFSTGWRGIFLASIPIDGGSVTKQVVVDTAVSIPGTPDAALFGCLSGPTVRRNGHVSFFGSNCRSTHVSQMVTAQMNNLFMYQTQPVLQHALTRGRQVGQSSLHAGLYHWTGGSSYFTVANDMTQVPGGSSGETFVAFSNMGLGIDGTGVFVGLGNNGSYGIYRVDSETQVSLVVDKKVLVPGSSDCYFANFPEVPSVDSAGQVVFFGQCNEKVGGVYHEGSNGKLGTLISYSDKVDGSETIYLGFGTNAVSGNKASIYIVLDDAAVTNGVWAFNVPTAADSLVL